MNEQLCLVGDIAGVKLTDHDASYPSPFIHVCSKSKVEILEIL